MSYVGRFAPSPTGPLHFGSLVAAVASWLDARAHHGRWLVRIEDVDTTRSVAGADDEILRALEAFGLEWDGEVVWQSRRGEMYESALEKLRSRGLVYRCRCSRKEVADSGIVGMEGAIYPGTCRALRLGKEIAGADRLGVDDARIEFGDRLQGRVSQDIARAIGDFVLKRRDGLHAYQLAVVVDDADQGVTDVVRGADLLQSTPRQILLQRLLDLPTPRHLHVPAAVDERGEKLSKQTRAAAVDAARAGEEIAAVLDFLGQPRPASRVPAEMLAEAVRGWDLRRIAQLRVRNAGNRSASGETPGV